MQEPAKNLQKDSQKDSNSWRSATEELANNQKQPVHGESKCKSSSPNGGLQVLQVRFEGFWSSETELAIRAQLRSQMNARNDFYLSLSFERVLE